MSSAKGKDTLTIVRDGFSQMDSIVAKAIEAYCKPDDKERVI